MDFSHVIRDVFELDCTSFSSHCIQIYSDDQWLHLYVSGMQNLVYLVAKSSQGFSESVGTSI